MEEKKKFAVIIGAGPAGLSAAWYLLHKTDVMPVILEEGDCFGGISRTVAHNGNRIDLGGHRFFSKSDEVMNLWQQILPLQSALAKDDILLGREVPLGIDGSNPEIEDKVFLKRNRISRILYLKKFFDYPISIKLVTFINMGFTRTFKAGMGYVFSCFNKREVNSLEDFFINRFGKPLYSMFFENYTEKLWGLHPSKISASWGAQRVKGLSLWKLLTNALLSPFKKRKAVETSLIESFLYPKLGAGQMWETMAEKIQKLGAKIVMNSKVSEVILSDDGSKVKCVIDDKGNKYDADYFFSSMPIKDLIEDMGAIVPQNIKDIAESLPYRDFMTVALLVPKLNLVNKTKIKTVNGIVPDCWIYVQESDVKMGRLQIFNNWSPYMVADFPEKVWVGLEYFCNEGDEYWNMSDEDFINFAKEEAEKIGLLDKDMVQDATRVRVKKAYPAYFGTYAQFEEVKDYLNKIDNLYPIGRNGQHRYNNMDHSMLTALAAVEVMQGKKTKDALWNVNAEQDYHETKF